MNRIQQLNKAKFVIEREISLSELTIDGLRRNLDRIEAELEALQKPAKPECRVIHLDVETRPSTGRGTRANPVASHQYQEGDNSFDNAVRAMEDGDD